MKHDLTQTRFSQTRQDLQPVAASPSTLYALVPCMGFHNLATETIYALAWQAAQQAARDDARQREIVEVN